MKTIVLCFVALFAIPQLNAQEELRNEVGFSLKGFNSFGLSAKFEAQPNRFWRVDAASFYGNADKNSTRDTIELNTKSFGLTVGFGKEIRKELTDNFYLHFGTDAIVGFAISNQEASVFGDFVQTSDESKNRTVNAGIGIPIGFDYILKNIVNFSIEFEPAFSYRYRSISTQNQDMNNPVAIITHSFDANANISALKITVAYRFEKRKNRGE